MFENRLGDVIDDHCIKCRRITNHSIVSLMNGEPAKVRCRTCYHDHDYRHEQAPPSKKDLKKQALFQEVLATVAPPPQAAAADPDPDPEPEPDVEQTAASESSAGPNGAEEAAPAGRKAKSAARPRTVRARKS